MSEKHDVLVIGAGPAGSTAARAAAENGARVLVVDKRRELGVPVQCGEALSEDILNELGIEPDPRWAINRINGTKLVSPSGTSITIREKKAIGKVGYILDRKMFDRHLAILAARAGVDIHVDTFVDGLVKKNGRVKGVTARTAEGRTEFHADVIIAADGVMSRVARWAGLNTTLGPEDIESGIQFKMVNVSFDSQDTMEFYFGSEIAPGGYVWVFPRGGDMANVGLGVLPARAEKNSIDYLKDFVKNNPNLQKGKIVEINAGGVPVSGPLDETVKDNMLIVGDAARQVNSLTGGGMNYSMKAGNIAGEVSAKVVEEGKVSEDRLSEYEDRWRDVMEKTLERYYKGKELLLDLSDEELDDIAETLQDVDFEEISLTKMLKVLVKSHPKLLWKLKGFL